MYVMELYLKNLENDSMVCKMVGVKTLLGLKCARLRMLCCVASAKNVKLSHHRKCKSEKQVTMSVEVIGL